MRRLLWAALALAVILAAVAGWNLVTRRPPLGESVAKARYAGSSTCRECHEDASAAWSTSHHALAERAFEPKGLGAAFRPDREIAHGSQRSVVRERGGRFEVLTVGADGKPGVFHPLRVIGVSPLWQPVVAAPGGRYQVTALAYAVGEGEWFDVYGAEDRKAHEWGFWANRGMTWNSMCAVCHVTGYAKSYSPSADSYASTQHEIGVGCESCHGPSQGHADAMRAAAGAGDVPLRGEGKAAPSRWLPESFRRRSEAPLATAAAEASGASAFDRAFETCGGCHSRREELTETLQPGEPFLDQFRPSIVDLSSDFYADGQVREENYEYASFLSSRMHLEGVRCVHCHDPHSGKTRASGNRLCLGCHQGRIDPATHSHHREGSDGAQCTACHMPATTFMQRHVRHDHGFTIPDPLLTQEHAIPNACNRCHVDRDAEWAARSLTEWYGTRVEPPRRRRARLVAQARLGDESARPGLLEVAITDPSPYWRAVAIGILGGMAPHPAVEKLLAASLTAAEPLTRALAVLHLEDRAHADPEAILPLLQDPVRLVRIDAAWTLRRQIDMATPAGRELIEYLFFHADQPTGAYRLSVFYQDRGMLPESRRWILHALKLDPSSPVLHQALASVERQLGNRDGWIAGLRRALDLEPNSAEAHFHVALALAEVADEKTTGGDESAGTHSLREATRFLREALRLEPGLSRAAYNLALALSRLGDVDEAIAALDRAELSEPANMEIHYARVTILVDARRAEAAKAALERLEALAPKDVDVAGLRAAVMRRLDDLDAANRVLEESFRGVESPASEPRDER